MGVHLFVPGGHESVPLRRAVVGNPRVRFSSRLMMRNLMTANRARMVR